MFNVLNLVQYLLNMNIVYYNKYIIYNMLYYGRLKVRQQYLEKRGYGKF